jgi:hypothetical protein
MDDIAVIIVHSSLGFDEVRMESPPMNPHIGRNEVVPEARVAWDEWLPVVSLVLFFISTTVFDARIMATQEPLVFTIFIPIFLLVQGYIVWYYFNKFRPARKMFTIYGLKIVGAYSWLFVVAMVGSSIVVLIGFYLI